MILSGAMVIPYGVVLMRITGIFLSAPGYSSLQIPLKIKVFAALSFAVILTPSLSPGIPTDLQPLMYPPTLLLELIIGVAIGLIFRWSMAGVGAAGELAGLQMGMGVASTIDPATGNNALFTQALMTVLYITIFLSLDGHHMILRTLHASYAVAPTGSSFTSGDGMSRFILQTAGILEIGLRLASGFIIPLLLVSFSMALVSRAFPQANIFVLSYAVSLLLGLTLWGTVAPAVRQTVADGITYGAREALWTVKSFTLQP